jgi:hypothetical protein
MINAAVAFDRWPRDSESLRDQAGVILRQKVGNDTGPRR